MEAGRELDVLVAEKVMGHRVDTVNGNFMEVGADFADDLLYYSTDIAAAWQVRETLKQRGWGVVLMNAFASLRRGWGEGCDIARDGVRYTEWGRTAAEAICLAALKASGVIIE